MSKNYILEQDIKNSIIIQAFEKNGLDPRHISKRLELVEIQGTPEQLDKLRSEFDAVGIDAAMELFKNFDLLIDDERNVLNSEVHWKRDLITIVTRWPSIEADICKLFGIPRHIYFDYYLCDRRPITTRDSVFYIKYAFEEAADKDPAIADKIGKMTWSFHSGDQSMISEIKEIMDPLIAKYQKD